MKKEEQEKLEQRCQRKKAPFNIVALENKMPSKRKWSPGKTRRSRVKLPRKNAAAVRAFLKRKSPRRSARRRSARRRSPIRFASASRSPNRIQKSPRKSNRNPNETDWHKKNPSPIYNNAMSVGNGNSEVIDLTGE